jgi:SOS-response transcriptional repressor LexA
MTISATKRQLDALRFIHGYQIAHGCSPTHRELGEGMGSPQGSATHDRIVALEERGFIRRSADTRPGVRQDIAVLVEPTIPRAPDGAPLYAVPGFGE